MQVPARLGLLGVLTHVRLAQELVQLAPRLDRSARGGFDLEDFRQAVDALQLDFTEAQTTALFAK